LADIGSPKCAVRCVYIGLPGKVNDGHLAQVCYIGIACSPWRDCIQLFQSVLIKAPGTQVGSVYS